TTGSYEATTLPGSQQMDLGSIVLKNLALCRFDTSCPRGMSNDMPRVSQCGTNGRSGWRKITQKETRGPFKCASEPLQSSVVAWTVAVRGATWIKTFAPPIWR